MARLEELRSLPQGAGAPIPSSERVAGISAGELRDLERMFRVERRYGSLTRWILLVSSILILWMWRGTLAFRQAELLVVLGYAILNLFFTIVFAKRLPLEQGVRASAPPAAMRWRRRLLLLSCALDHLYVATLIAISSGFQSEFYLLFGFLALRAAVYYPSLLGMIYISFLSFILWSLACYLNVGSFFFLVDREFLVRYGGLLLWILGCLAVGQAMARRQQSIQTLDVNLSRKNEALEEQARVVQNTVNELANRLLELRSLQESIKAINSALALDELLQLIVENATQVLRGARCTIALVDDERQRVVTAAAAGIPRQELWGTAFRFGEGVAGWVVENGRPVRIGAVDQDPRFVRIGNQPIASLISVPLFAEADSSQGTLRRSVVIGALTATSPDPNAFSDADVALLDAFGDQAVIAVRKARLYEQLVREEQETARLYQSVLEKSNELEAILRGIGDGVIVVDPHLRLLMMNPVAARTFRILEMPTPGTRLPELVANEDLLALAQDTLEELDSPLIREIVLPAEGDRTRIYEALASTIRGASGRPRGVAIVMRDITSQKEIEQMKTDFLSVVSHELRTPLHSIKGFVDIILMGKTGQINDLQRDFLTTVQESTANLQRLIDDLLEFSRMEAGQIKLKPEMISLYDIAETVVERLGPLAQEGQLALLNEVPENIALIEADPMRVEQVLTNLVTNGIKFTPEGGSVTVSAFDLGAQVRVSVRDTGIGIPEAEQARIFERFYQVDSSATRSYRGAGLGLTICKFIVEYHHGRIWVDSVEGKGSTFSFLLPKELPKDDALVIDFTTPARRR